MFHLGCSKFVEFDARDVLTERQRPELLDVGLFFEHLFHFGVLFELRLDGTRSVKVSL